MSSRSSKQFLTNTRTSAGIQRLPRQWHATSAPGWVTTSERASPIHPAQNIPKQSNIFAWKRYYLDNKFLVVSINLTPKTSKQELQNHIGGGFNPSPKKNGKMEIFPQRRGENNN